MNDQLKYYQNKLAYEIDSSDLFDAMQNNENIVVIDARKHSAFDVEHIPNAINIPHREMNQYSIKNLDRNALYIIYCDGIGCNASTKGALNMTKLGFNVKELIGGLEWWKLDGYKTEGINTKSSNNEFICSC